MRRAVSGLEELKRHLDTTIVVPNQNLFKIANESTGFEESFSLSNDVLKAWCAKYYRFNGKAWYD